MLIKKTIFSSAIVVMGGLFATSAMADGGDKTAMHDDKQAKQVDFQKVDQNGDGSISETEFQSADIEAVDHQALDTDSDGSVSRTEFAAFERLTDEQTNRPATQSQQGTDHQESEWETEPSEHSETEESSDY